MRKRRIDAKIRVIARTLLAGESQPSETCYLLLPYTYRNPELFTEEDKVLLRAVDSEIDDLPVGKLRENWHPDFLPAKLEQLAKYDAAIQSNVRGLCERLLAVFESRKLEQKEDEDS